jgi:TetR/AcrR family transcriptional regulator, biofilm operon repressor
MARPPNADGARTRQAILDAALGLFADKGYFGTSLRDVARAVGIRESALYNYFVGKEALFEALLEAESAVKVERLSEILDAPVTDGRVVLDDLASFIIDRFVVPRQQQLFRILMSDGMRLAREGRINLHERMSSTRPHLEEIMRRLIDAGFLRDVDPEMLVMQFIGPLLFWRQLHAIGAKTALIRNRHAFARAHVDQFLNGAAAEPSVVPSRVRKARSA